MTKVLAVACAFALLAVASAADSQSPVPFLVWSGQSNLAIHNSVAQQVRNAEDALSVVDTVLSPVSGPAPEVLVAFVAPKLSAASASLLSGAYSGSASSSLSSIKSAFSSAASSLAFPEMYPVGPLPIGQKLSKMMTKHNSRLIRLSLKGECSSTLAKLESDAIIGQNKKTDLIVVSFDSVDSDACVAALLEKVATMTNGHYVALFTADAGENIKLVFPTADNHENSVFLESGVRVMSSAGVGPLYISPAILFGLMFGLVFIITALIGICCLDSIQTPLRFPSRKVNWGKEV